MSGEHSQRNMMLSALVGGAIGAGLGLLFAPKSGRETRAQIKSSATTAKKRAQKSVRSAKQTLSQQVDKAKEMRQRLSAAAQSGKEELKSEAHKAKGRVNVTERHLKRAM